MSAIEKWTRIGKTLYEAPFSLNGQERELTTGEDGKLLTDHPRDDEDDD